MPTKKVDIVDPVTYMRMYNEALMARDPLATPRYSALDISRRQNKNFPSWAYPANDWMDILFKDYNINHRLGVNIRGGSKVMQYYASVNYVRDMGMLKTDRLNEFDVNIKEQHALVPREPEREPAPQHQVALQQPDQLGQIPRSHGERGAGLPNGAGE